MSSKELKGSNNPEQAPAKTGERKRVPKFSRKGLVWCLIGVVFVGLSTAAILLNNKRIALEATLEKAVNEKIALQGQLVQITEAKVSVEKKLVIVEGDLNSERARAIALDLQLTEAKRQREEILARIGQQDELIQEFQGKIQEFQVSQEGKGKPAETALVELEKIIVSHRPRLEGEVIGVNEQYPWVVVNLGKVNNLQQGMILSVLREGEVIGKIQVEEILNEMANARILSQKEGARCQVADLVREM